MSDKGDGRNEVNSSAGGTAAGGGGNGGGGGGGKINMRKLSFMKSFTSRQNSESATTPTTDSNNISLKTDSPKQRKSITHHRESIGSSSDIEEEFHEFTAHVQDLGKIELRNPGLDEFMEVVGTTYLKAKPHLKTMEKSILTLNQDGIHIKHDSSNRVASSVSFPNNVHDSSSETMYKIRRILYCAVDKTHQKVFFFNYQYGSRAEKTHLHMLVCKTHKDAKEIAKKCSFLFRKIQSELHKRDKEKREDHIQSVQKIRTRSNQNIATSSATSSTVGSKEGSCSGTYGSDEWVQDRIELSMA